MYCVLLHCAVLFSPEVALESVALGVLVKGTLSVMDEVSEHPVLS